MADFVFVTYVRWAFKPDGDGVLVTRPGETRMHRVTLADLRRGISTGVLKARGRVLGTFEVETLERVLAMVGGSS